jgi:hypothetical protein
MKYLHIKTDRNYNIIYYKFSNNDMIFDLDAYLVDSLVSNQYRDGYCIYLNIEFHYIHILLDVYKNNDSTLSTILDDLKNL